MNKVFFTACVLLVTVHSLHSTYGAATNKSADDLPIKYPGPVQEVPENRYKIPDDIPEECKGQTYCSIKPPDYPEDKYNNMFKDYKGVKQPTPVFEPDLGNRQGDPSDEDNCESLITFEPLYKVLSKRGDWRTVVQAPKHDYVQKVRLETCKNPNARCFTIFPQMDDYSIFCKQKYIDWQVLVDDGNNGVETIETELPICCSCHYKAVGLASRFGKPKN